MIAMPASGRTCCTPAFCMEIVRKLAMWWTLPVTIWAEVGGIAASWAKASGTIAHWAGGRGTVAHGAGGTVADWVRAR